MNRKGSAVIKKRYNVRITFQLCLFQHVVKLLWKDSKHRLPWGIRQCRIVKIICYWMSLRWNRRWFWAHSSSVLIMRLFGWLLLLLRTALSLSLFGSWKRLIDGTILWSILALACRSLGYCPIRAFLCVAIRITIIVCTALSLSLLGSWKRLFDGTILWSILALACRSLGYCPIRAFLCFAIQIIIIILYCTNSSNLGGSTIVFASLPTLKSRYAPFLPQPD
mmetsp:Transcript_10185/g.24365  ORF Transcript_10185/g.24365 Transcript_10185/m.24365 type:complete len:222 (+) Transcript_10185:2129-2794(+)